MDIQNANSLLFLTALLFTVGLIGLFFLTHSNKRTVCVKSSDGIFITDDGNENISAYIHISQKQNDATSTLAWRKIAVIATLAYSPPQAGV